MRNLWLVVALLSLVAAGCKDEPKPKPRKRQLLQERRAKVLDGLEERERRANPVKRFVQASSLKLRAVPAGDGRVIGRVSINSPLEVFGEKAGFAQVRVADGKEGWVAAEYLGLRRIGVEGARERAANAETPELRLSWLQRAAAIDATDLAVLGELRAAYQALGEGEEAKKIGALLDKLTEVKKATRGRLLGVHDSGVEWQSVGDVGFTHAQIPRERWTDAGISSDELWGLSAMGVAKKLEPQRVEREMWNECAGAVGVTVYFSGAADLAFHGAPPASWKTAPVTWSAEQSARLKARVRAAHCDEGLPCEVFVATAKGHGAVGRAVSTRVLSGSDDEVEYAMVHTVDVRVAVDDPEGELTVVSDKKGENLTRMFASPRALRDLVGDEAPEVLFIGPCDAEVRALSGETLFSSEYRCCN